MLNVLKIAGLLRRAAQARSARLLRQFAILGPLPPDVSEKFVFGHPETPQEIVRFLDFVRPMGLFAVITIHPSGILPYATSTPLCWAHGLWLDSAVFVGPLGGSWNVAIRCKCRIARIRQVPSWISTDTIRDAYLRIGLSIGDGEEGVKRSTPMAIPSARVVLNQVNGGTIRLSYESKTTPLATREVKRTTFEWPANFADGMGINTNQKIVCLGGCSFWNDDAWKHSAEAADALWRSYPDSIVKAAMGDLKQTNVGLSDETGITSTADQLQCRTGGHDLLTSRVRAAFGMGKFEAPMSGVASSTRKGCPQLWYEWVIFCAIRRYAQWLISSDVTRKEELIDFPMWIREMVRLSAPTCSRYISAIRFPH